MFFDIKYSISKFCDKKTMYILRRIDTEFKYIIDKQIFQDCINCNKITLINKCKTCKHTFCFDCFTNDENKNSKYCSECFIGYCDLCENEIDNEYGIDIYDLPDEDNPRIGCSVRSRKDYYYDKVFKTCPNRQRLFLKTINIDQNVFLKTKDIDPGVFLKKCGNIICNECRSSCIDCRTCIDCEVKCISCNACLRCVDFCDTCGNCTDCTTDLSNDCENCKEYKSDTSESDEYTYNSDKSDTSESDEYTYNSDKSDESDESEYEFELHI